MDGVLGEGVEPTKSHEAVSQSFSLKMSRHIASVVEDSATNKKRELALGIASERAQAINMIAIDDALGKAITEGQVQLALQSTAAIALDARRMEADTEDGRTRDMELKIGDSLQD